MSSVLPANMTLQMSRCDTIQTFVPSQALGGAISSFTSSVQGLGLTGKNTILVVLPENDVIHLLEKDEAGRPREFKTGYFLNELAIPLNAIVRAGFIPVLATPTGRIPIMDEGSARPALFGGSQPELDNALRFVDSLEGMKHPVALGEISRDEALLANFAGVFVPGGHATMEGLPTDTNVASILTFFHEQKKPTALICHGVGALLAVRGSNDKAWPWVGYRMTAYDTEAEKLGEAGGYMGGGHIQYYLADELANRGAIIEVAKPWTSKTIVDRELVTGQNPQSDEEFTVALFQSLSTYLQPAGR